MFMNRFILATFVLAALAGCQKKQDLNTLPGDRPTKPVAPSQQGSKRGTLVKNLPFTAELKAAIEKDIDGGLCAQEVIMGEGDYRGERFVEVSQGPCPAGNALVDDKKVTVFPLIVFESTGEGAELDLLDLEYAQRAGRVEFATSGTAAVKLTSLCTHEDDLCYFRITDRKFTGVEMY